MNISLLSEVIQAEADAARERQASVDAAFAQLDAAFARMIAHGPKPLPPTTGASGSPAVAPPLRSSVVGDPYSADAGDSSQPASVFSTRTEQSA